LIEKLKKITLYLDTKKWDGCRAKFQWARTWEWWNLEATTPSTSFSKSTSMLKQHKFRFSLTTYHFIAFSFASGCKPHMPHNSLVALNKPRISQEPE
jgi:hypothetical protein